MTLFDPSSHNDRKEAKERILARINEAINLDTMQETGRAVELLQALLLEFPEEPSVHVYLAWYLRRCDRFVEAIAHSKIAVHLLPTSSRASLVLFHTLWKAGNKEEAIAEIRRFLPIRRTAKHTSGYLNILKKWESGDRGEGAYPVDEDDDRWLLQ